MFFRRRQQADDSSSANRPLSTADDPTAALPREVEDCLAELALGGWDLMTREDFNPVTLALELLDHSTANSRDLETFGRLLGRLERGMDLVVDEHYQAFNQSVETFGRALDLVGGAQQQVRGLQADLGRAKELLICRRPDLLQLWAKSAQYKEMIRMLTAIEELKKATEQVQQLVQERRYLSAVRALLASLKTVNGSDFVDIAALSDIRQSLYAIRGSMYETMLDELHRCLYLKAPAYAQLNVNTLRFNNDRQHARARSPRHAKELSESSAHSADWPDSASIVDDTDADPQANPVHFLTVLLAALNLLGKSDAIRIVLKQRSSLELFKLIDRVLDDVVSSTTSSDAGDVSSRSESNLLLEVLSVAGAPMTAKKFLGAASADNGDSLLEKFIASLYQQLELSMELHRFSFHTLLQQSQNGGNISENSKVIQNYMLDLWASAQEHVKTILINYIAANKNPYATVGKSDKDDHVTERRNLFQFSDSDAVWQISKSAAVQADSELDSPGAIGVVDRLATSSSKASHRLVATPSIFNLAVLFQPTIDFVGRVEVAFHFRTEKRPDLLVFVEDVLLKDFIRSIEEVVIQRFHEAVNSIDSFRVDKVEISDRPIFRCVMLLMDLIKEFLVAVYRIPSHQDEFIRIVETILLKFYDRCLFRVKSTLGMDGDETATPLVSTIFAGTDEIETIYKSNTLLRNPDGPNTAFNHELGQRLRDVETELKSAIEMKREALMFDGKRINFLANTRTSLAWFVKQVELLRRRGSDNGATIEIRPPSEVLTRSQQTFNMDLLLTHKEHSNQNFSDYPFAFLKEAVCFSLPDNVAIRIDGTIQNFLGLSWQCLFILKSELRCHCYFFVESCTAEGNFAPNETALEPDPYIFAMNQDTTNFDKLISRALSANERAFIFESISDLISASLVEHSDQISEINQFGIEKMIKNILATQQNLSNIIGSEARLDFAKKYYQLFFSTGQDIIRALEENGPTYTEEQYVAALNYIYRKAITIPDHPQKPEYDKFIQQLSQIFS